MFAHLSRCLVDAHPSPPLIGRHNPISVVDWSSLTCRDRPLVHTHLSRLLIGVDECGDEWPDLPLQDGHADAEEGVERVALLPTVGTA